MFCLEFGVLLLDVIPTSALAKHVDHAFYLQPLLLRHTKEICFEGELLGLQDLVFVVEFLHSPEDAPLLGNVGLHRTFILYLSLKGPSNLLALTLFSLLLTLLFLAYPIRRCPYLALALSHLVGSAPSADLSTLFLFLLDSVGRLRFEGS